MPMSIQCLVGTDHRFATQRPVFVTLGMFDGMHLGHLSLIRQLSSWARSKAGFSAVLTFDKHPRSVINGESPPLITPLDHKKYLLSRLGIDGVIVLPFEKVVAEISASDFIKGILKNQLNTKGVLLGFNNRFGKGGEGNFSLLRKVGKEIGMESRQGKGIWLGGTPISSTQIRNAIREGNLQKAEFYLGRKYSILGTVVKGKQVGRQLGYPTANVQMSHTLVPPPGVYSSITRVRNLFFPSATFISPFSNGVSQENPLVETHIMGFNEEVYGSQIEIILIEFLRGDRKFADLPTLKQQITTDVRQSLISASKVII